MSIVILMGSGPDVLRLSTWQKRPSEVFVAINNAWGVRRDWDWLVHPEDFPVDRRPTSLREGQAIVTADDYIPVQNAFGGIVYCGGTMAFTAAYWALRALRPKVIATIGCDMVYPRGENTHFYGTGTPDPLRKDVTLRSLEAKSARFMVLAARAGCAVVNLSEAAESRLVYPRHKRHELDQARPMRFSPKAVDAALWAEAQAAYQVPSGRYWECEDRFDPEVIDRIDQHWLAVLDAADGLTAKPFLTRQQRLQITRLQ